MLQQRRKLRRSSRLLPFLIAACAALLVVVGQAEDAPTLAQTAAPHELPPVARAHPLPVSLAQWQDPENAGDYFSTIKPTEAGYLVWSQFPVKVYIEPEIKSEASETSTSQPDRSSRWVEAVTQAVREWQVYLPLETTDRAETADISIWHSTPPLQATNTTTPTSRTAATTLPEMPRVRSAATHYELFVNRPADAPATLAHRCVIQLNPSQTSNYIQASARHELGHALGIWGHSPSPTDALYFAQVRNPPPISDRDVNTLKRVYQQPTQLGWAILLG